MTTSLPPITDNPARGDLKSRTVVGVLLIVLAVACLWWGGMAFGALVALAVLLVFAEWSEMHRIGRSWRLFGLVALAGICSLAILDRMLLALGLLVVAVIVFGISGRVASAARWTMTGLLYAALPAVALIWLRAQPSGFSYVLWTFAVVWATDIFAYFAGRNLGGPRLAPKISPKKTWSGLAGGVAGAAFTGGMLASGLALEIAALPAALAGGGFAILSQAGDLYESWLKRRVGVKDSGTLLPGHGGVMDRIDGMVPVAVAVALMLWVAS